LIYSVIKMLGGVEKTFNDIWGVSAGRPFHRKFADYLSVLMIAPILILASTGFNATLSSNRIFERLEDIEVVSSAVHLLLRLTPLFALWIAFTFAYIFIPYTKVKFFPGLTAGIIAGTLWHIAQWGYIEFQVGVAKYNAIYGTFASLPIFVVWLQFSWIIVLLGCQICYAVQHQRSYQQPLPDYQTPISLMEQAAIAVLLETLRRFRAGVPLVTADQAADLANTSPQMMAHIVQRLVDARLLARLEGQEQHLVPARDIANENLADLLRQFRQQGTRLPFTASREAPDWIRAIHEKLEQGWAGRDEFIMSALVDGMTQ